MILKPRSVREFRNPSEDYSVRATAELFQRPNVDGGLIGGAALNAEDFAAIVRCAEEAA